MEENQNNLVDVTNKEYTYSLTQTLSLDHLNGNRELYKCFIKIFNYIVEKGTSEEVKAMHYILQTICSGGIIQITNFTCNYRLYSDSASSFEQYIYMLANNNELLPYICEYVKTVIMNNDNMRELQHDDRNIKLLETLNINNMIVFPGWYNIAKYLLTNNCPEYELYFKEKIFDLGIKKACPELYHFAKAIYGSDYDEYIENNYGNEEDDE